ncbi:MAG: hypothetical protein ACREJC_05765, partial [Tepidisphaeraceae bacterium]
MSLALAERHVGQKRALVVMDAQGGTGRPARKERKRRSRRAGIGQESVRLVADDLLLEDRKAVQIVGAADRSWINLFFGEQLPVIRHVGVRIRDDLPNATVAHGMKLLSRRVRSAPLHPEIRRDHRAAIKAFEDRGHVRRRGSIGSIKRELHVQRAADETEVFDHRAAEWNASRRALRTGGILRVTGDQHGAIGFNRPARSERIDHAV